MKAEDVKQVRSYENRNRRDQARQTRLRVIEAARTLFVRHGYASTTIQAIAEEAGVAVQTIYASFGSKREVLKELFDISIVGDNEQAPLIERPEWRAWEEESEPGPQIDLFAQAQRMTCSRTAEVMQVLLAAAASDPEIAQTHKEAEGARYRDQHRLADALSGRGQLRHGLSPDRAADVIWTLAGPGTYTDLVRHCGWDEQHYEQWLSAQLRAALLP
jgi:TetR/AcrR family transcriptional regulator, regulator of autoinduction and epiphytic fitness